MKLNNSIEQKIKREIDSINENEKVEINLKDLLYLFKVMEEFNNFFHQESNYQNSFEVQDYMKSGAYNVIRELYYDTLWSCLPKDIQTKIENGDRL